LRCISDAISSNIRIFRLHLPPLHLRYVVQQAVSSILTTLAYVHKAAYFRE